MISRRPVPALLLAALGILLTATAHAAVPSPANSTVDACIRVCPAGDMNIHVVVRDGLNLPVAASTVMADFVNCFGLTFCPSLGTEPYTFVPPASILMTTDAAGVVDIPLRAGGVCVPSPPHPGVVNIFADGVLLATRTSVASPDQNGDLMVDAADNGILTAKLGTFDPTGDLNCSGLVDVGDPNILVAHAGHSCLAVVPNQRKSWGSMKVIYR